MPAAPTVSPPPLPQPQDDPEELTLRLERVGGKLVELTRDPYGKRVASQLMECVQELRLVWSALRQFCLVYDPNQLEKMLEHEREIRQAMEILNGTVGSLSRTGERTAANVDRTLHELDGLEVMGDTSLMVERLRTVTGSVREAASEMKTDIAASAVRLDESEQIIRAVDQKLRDARTQIMHDSLTRLLSRPALEQRLRELDSQSPAVTGAWCVVLADIDGLGQINERHGRLVGDALLIKVAEIIQKTCETLPGAIVGRYGGEEFGVILPRCSLREGRQMAEEIRGAVGLARWECKAASAPTVLTATVSLGVVQHRNAEGVPELLRRLESCLQQAQRRGRNSIGAEA
jgi:diguanylate cyclase (GGDEF)-like protein